MVVELVGALVAPVDAFSEIAGRHLASDLGARQRNVGDHCKCRTLLGDLLVGRPQGAVSQGLHEVIVFLAQEVLANILVGEFEIGIFEHGAECFFGVADAVAHLS